ncbi:hypothetical protein KY363_01960 [Candidatus Woesearchaeota archaeon]|nr:hypothetical protein [Candidatus Woesearchaeota archaeon]
MARISRTFNDDIFVDVEIDSRIKPFKKHRYSPAGTSAVVGGIVGWSFDKALAFLRSNPFADPNPFKVWLPEEQIEKLSLADAAPNGKQYGRLVVQSGSANYIADVYLADTAKGEGIALSEQLAYGLGLHKGSKVMLYLPRDEQQRVTRKMVDRNVAGLVKSLIEESAGLFDDSAFDDGWAGSRHRQLDLPLDLLHSSVSEYSISAAFEKLLDETDPADLPDVVYDSDFKR